MRPGEIHVERNLGESEPLRMVVVRTPSDMALEVAAPPGWTPA
jgi:hypothetical protein